MDAYASLPHLVDHLVPLWRALPPSARGTFYAGSRTARRYAEGIGVRCVMRAPTVEAIPTLVANHDDYRHTDVRPVVYVEHGAGQTYIVPGRTSGHPHYSGGADRDRVVLFLTLNHQTARREAAVYGADRVAAVGSARLDVLCRHHHGHVAASRPVVGLAWHWPLRLVPECEWAFPVYQAAVQRLVDGGRYTVLGHGHPRVWRQLEAWYTAHGVQPVGFQELCDRADVLCLDNTSAGPEFAAVTGRPLVWLNRPGYRRDVHHGGRFWQWPHRQVQVNDPADLEAGVVEALFDWPGVAQARARMVNAIYPPALRGTAARRAVAEMNARNLLDI